MQYGKADEVVFQTMFSGILLPSSLAPRVGLGCQAIVFIQNPHQSYATGDPGSLTKTSARLNCCSELLTGTEGRRK